MLQAHGLENGSEDFYLTRGPMGFHTRESNVDSSSFVPPQ